jgi:hypothetical protein
MSNKNTDPAAAAASVAITATAAATVTPKTGITNVYSRTTADQISILRELLHVTNKLGWGFNTIKRTKTCSDWLLP